MARVKGYVSSHVVNTMPAGSGDVWLGLFFSLSSIATTTSLDLMLAREETARGQILFPQSHALLHPRSGALLTSSEPQFARGR